MEQVSGLGTVVVQVFAVVLVLGAVVGEVFGVEVVLVRQAGIQIGVVELLEELRLEEWELSEEFGEQVLQLVAELALEVEAELV